MKISQYPSYANPTLADIVPIVNTATDTTEQTTLSAIAALLQTQLQPAGSIIAYGGRSAPGGWLLCFGQAVSRTTFATLFAALAPLVGTPTITIASPGVLTLNGHGFVTGDLIFLTTSGTLPTGLTANTIYYVINVTTNTFKLATTAANAYAGTAINTSGTQTGTHSLYACPYGLGDGTTTFNVPDFRGRVQAGNDSMGGTAANRLLNNSTGGQGTYGNQGAAGGENNHFQITSEMPAHNHSASDSGHQHTENVATTGGGGTGITGTANIIGNAGSNQTTATGFANITIGTTGNGLATNNVQPTLVTNVIIKT